MNELTKFFFLAVGIGIGLSYLIGIVIWPIWFEAWQMFLLSASIASASFFIAHKITRKLKVKNKN